jgi:hypothetical protein
MEYTLYKIKQEFIVTSDEDLKIGDECVNPITNEFFKVTGLNQNINDKKLIAQENQIDFTSLSYENQFKIGWFNVQQLSNIDVHIETDYDKFFKEGYTKGFEKSQELLSNKKFTTDEVSLLFEKIKNSVPDLNLKKWDSNSLKPYLDSILSKPKSWIIKGHWNNNQFKITELI